MGALTYFLKPTIWFDLTTEQNIISDLKYKKKPTKVFKKWKYLADEYYLEWPYTTF